MYRYLRELTQRANEKGERKLFNDKALLPEYPDMLPFG